MSHPEQRRKGRIRAAKALGGVSALDQGIRPVGWPAVGRVVEQDRGRALQCFVVPLEAELTHASFVEAEHVTNLVAHGLDDLRT